MSYALYKQPYYDSVSQQYINIITINCIPVGPLSKIVRRIHMNKLSAYTDEPTACKLAITRNNELLTFDELSWLVAFLHSNGYRIDTRLSELVKDEQLIFYIHFHDIKN